jgi:hypothetical protein
MNSKLIGLAVRATFFGTATLLGGVSQASAVIMDVTYTGTVSSGTDTFAVSGKAGANLAGSSWVVTYTYDTSLGYSKLSSYENNVYAGSQSQHPVISENPRLRLIA